MASLFFGFNPPFLTDTAVMPLQTDERLIKNDLLQLLLTVPGERVFRPTFGTAIRSTLFEPIDDLSIDNLKTSIEDAVDAFEPRVTLTEVRISPKADLNTIEIKVFGFVTIDPNITFELELTLPTGPATTEFVPRQRAT